MRASAALLALTFFSGCAKRETIITPAVGPHAMTAVEIDADPLAILPTGFVGLLRAEVPAVAKSTIGPSLLAFTNRLAPLPPNSGFVPERDLDRIVVGFYSLQGADVAGIATGRFNPDAIRNAAAATTTTPSGTLVQSPYAGYLLYTVRNIGFCALTARTILFGNETGIRRALDRIHDGRAVHELPDWTNTLLEPSRAPFAFGGNLESNSLPAGVSQQVPFLAGLHAMRVLGNFESPGVNLAGSLGYETPERAKQAAQEMLSSRDLLKSYGWIMSVLGVSQPIQRLEAQSADREVSFVAALDGAVATRAIDEIPILCALAARASGVTEITDVAELRVKESDRLATMANVLRAFGVECEERPDGLRIEGRSEGPLLAVHVESHGDHRIAMTAAVLGLVADGPTEIEDTDCIATSFPRFVETLRELGANLEVLP